MAAKKTDPAKKAAVLKDIEENGKSVMQASKDHGVPSATAYGWTAARKKRRKAKAAASKAAKNGHATNGEATPAPAPAIELRGLRAWVDAAVDARLDARFRQLANQGRS